MSLENLKSIEHVVKQKDKIIKSLEENKQKRDNLNNQNTNNINNLEKEISKKDMKINKLNNKNQALDIDLQIALNESKEKEEKNK